MTLIDLCSNKYSKSHDDLTYVVKHENKDNDQSKNHCNGKDTEIGDRKMRGKHCWKKSTTYSKCRYWVCSERKMVCALFITSRHATLPGSSRVLLGQTNTRTDDFIFGGFVTHIWLQTMAWSHNEHLIPATSWGITTVEHDSMVWYWPAVLPPGGYSLIWAIQICAAPKGMVFQPFWS